MADREITEFTYEWWYRLNRLHTDYPTYEAFDEQLQALIADVQIQARMDELLEIGLLAHKFEGEDYHCREIADAIDERLAQTRLK